jgi:N-acetylmuramoyl-L-alanine amidase
LQDSNRFILFAMFILIVVLAVIFLLTPSTDSHPAFKRASIENVLVIDPGHGGEDGGAVTRDGVKESEINLQIALRMAEICDFCGIPYKMTRTSEEINYPEELKSTAKRKRYDQDKRLDLIESVENAVLISIHQNKFTSSSPRGPQAFFSANDGSKELAILVQEKMNTVLYPQNRRIAVQIPDSIYLMNSLDCVAVLAECGFLSNPVEGAALREDGYQSKVALCLVSSYCVFCDSRQQYL